MPTPKWLIDLPPGKYDMDELEQITGRTKTTIKAVLQRYGARVIKTHSGYKNLIKNVYIWSGYRKLKT